jgi:hypothetical protein
MPAWPMVVVVVVVVVVVQQVAEAQQHGGSPRSRANAQQIGRPWPGALQPYDDRAGVAATRAAMCHSSIPQPLGSPQRAHRPAAAPASRS